MTKEESIKAIGQLLIIRNLYTEEMLKQYTYEDLVVDYITTLLYYGNASFNIQKVDNEIIITTTTKIF